MKAPPTDSRQEILDHILMRLFLAASIVSVALFLLHHPPQFIVLAALIAAPVLALIALRLLLALPMFGGLTRLTPTDALLISISYALLLFCTAEMAFPGVGAITTFELPILAFISWTSLPVAVCVAALSWLLLLWPPLSGPKKLHDHSQWPS